eukprot:Phypoly_transcript_12553.p1 GENE.Phypoly_transcript_12553~~Phypoly_transcript_12553.p1  ORF type:complete len:120 (+),score=24.43 Phypoly_transcript_12553:699-1058(+)
MISPRHGVMRISASITSFSMDEMEMRIFVMEGSVKKAEGKITVTVLLSDDGKTITGEKVVAKKEAGFDEGDAEVDVTFEPPKRGTYKCTIRVDKNGKTNENVMYLDVEGDKVRLTTKKE